MFDFDDSGDFRLTDQERKRSLKNSAMTGLYLLLAVVVLVTGAHAVMLVLSQAPKAVGESGFLTAVLNVIRVAFPVTMELAAVVAGLGFIGARWRKDQKKVALAIEIVWIIFAASNMVTFFRVERGLPLENWQMAWINYGLPLSSLIAGVLAYYLTRSDPDLKRKDEETAADEKIAMIRFSARRDVATSSQRVAIERQRAWIDFVKELRSHGYSDLQIRYMLQDTPDLMVDRDGDGRMDLLEDGNQNNDTTPNTNQNPDPYNINGRPPSHEWDTTPEDQPPSVPRNAVPGSAWFRVNGEWKLMIPAVPLNGHETQQRNGQPAPN